jgi:hypothetical protein
MKNHAIILFYILFSVQVWDKFMKNIKMKMDSYILLTVEKIHLDVECNQLFHKKCNRNFNGNFQTDLIFFSVIKIEYKKKSLQTVFSLNECRLTP